MARPGIKIEIKFSEREIRRAIGVFGALSESDVKAIMTQARKDFGEPVLAQTQDKVPVITGNLRATGALLGPQKLPNKSSQILVKYGGRPGKGRQFPNQQALGEGGKVNYAAQVHSNSNRGRNFLVGPFLAQARKFEKSVAKSLRQIAKLRRKRAA